MGFAITSFGRVNDLMNNNKADISVMNNLQNMQAKYETSRNQYRRDRAHLREMRERENAARERMDSLSILVNPILKFRAWRAYRAAVNRTNIANADYRASRAKYRVDLLELRDTRREVRREHRKSNQYEALKRRIVEAQSMGISVPQYIIDESNKQVLYTLQNGGSRIAECNQDCYRELISMINEVQLNQIKQVGSNVANFAKNIVGNLGRGRNKQKQDDEREL